MTLHRTAIALTVVNLVLLTAVLAQNRPTSAQGVAPVLRGQSLEIVDTRGTIRARINVEPAATVNGQSYPEQIVFRLTDPSGLIRVKLGAGHDGSGLVLADDTQQPGIHMLAKGSGSFVKVVNKDGREQQLKP